MLQVRGISVISQSPAWTSCPKEDEVSFSAQLEVEQEKEYPMSLAEPFTHQAELLCVYML